MVPVRLACCGSSVYDFLHIVSNTNVMFPTHPPNKRLKRIGRGIKRIDDKAIKVALSKTIIALERRMLQQCVRYDFKSGTPVAIGKQNIQIGLTNIKREAKADNP